MAWALSPIFSPGNLTLPSASLPRWLGIDDGRGPLLSRNFRALTDDPKLLAFLLAHRGTARFLVAAPNAAAGRAAHHPYRPAGAWRSAASSATTRS